MEVATWCTGEEKAAVIDELKHISCCDLCIIRYLGVKEPYIYRDQAAISRILGRENNASSENRDSNESKKVKANPCTACLGLLQIGAGKDSLDKIVTDIKESNIEALTFCPVLSVPISIQLRAHSIWWHLTKKFPSVYNPLREYKPESISLKSAWKWVATKILQNEVNPNSDWNNDGKLTVQIYPFYVDEEKECKPMEEYITQGGKIQMKKGRVAVTRTSVELALSKLTSEQYEAEFQCPPSVPTSSITIDRILCTHAPIFVAGRYCKYSRVLSQTPWVIDGSRKTEDSVEELISSQILPLLGADEAKFSSSGREDVDVRTLGKGRPFVLEVINPKRTIFTKDRMRELETKINESTSLISVRDLQIVEKKDLTVLKDGEEAKTKVYCALCIAPLHTITEEHCQILNSVKLPLVLMQKTPVRVMHRRSVAIRERSILEMKAELVPPSQSENSITSHLFKLYLTTEAGTYVKEFVHGDLGRTSPNVSELLGFSADIVALDVEAVNVDWPPTIDGSSSVSNIQPDVSSNGNSEINVSPSS